MKKKEEKNQKNVMKMESVISVGIFQGSSYL